MACCLELADVVRDYGNGVRIGPVGFKVERGVFVSLLGPSGCGKTTLLRCVAGFEPIDGGRLLIDGRDVSRSPAHRREVGLVFQSYALFPHLTVADNVAFGLKLRKIARHEREARVAEALGVVGLGNLADRMPSQISGGQQQRVAIARSLVLQPSLMLLDEPLSNLDYKLRLEMRRELHALQRRLGMTFVFVTHDQTEALALSDQIVVLSQGRVEQIGTPAEIYASPQTRFVADFLGGSNLLKARSVSVAGAGRVLAELEIGGTMTARASASWAGGDAWVAVRPEDLKLVPASDTLSDGADTLTGRTVARIFAGDRIEVTIELERSAGSAPVPVTFHARSAEELPSSVRLRVEPGSAVLVAG